MNPYDTLGVPRDATEHQIKIAYRQRVKETHPDTGADGSDFHDVGTAYAVLRDKDRRKLYDDTGSINASDVRSSHEAVLNVIAQMFDMAINIEGQSGRSFKHIDLMEAMKANLSRLKVEGSTKMANIRKAVADREVLRTRIIRKGDGENLFVAMLDRQLTELRTTEAKLKVDVSTLERAQEELSHYQSVVEVVQAMQTFVWGGGAFNGAATNNSVFTRTR